MAPQEYHDLTKEQLIELLVERDRKEFEQFADLQQNVRDENFPHSSMIHEIFAELDWQPTASPPANLRDVVQAITRAFEKYPALKCDRKLTEGAYDITDELLEITEGMSPEDRAV